MFTMTLSISYIIKVFKVILKRFLGPELEIKSMEKFHTAIVTSIEFPAVM